MLTSIRGLMAATILAGSSFAAMPALADETDPPSEFTITGNVAMVSDYRFRGLSFTAGDPAIQGGINVNHKSGFYVGAHIGGALGLSAQGVNATLAAPKAAYDTIDQN